MKVRAMLRRLPPLNAVVSLRMQKTYWIVCPKVTASVPKISMFRDWLLAEAAEDARRLRTLAPKIVTRG
jgi:hypothetical protein